MQSTAIINCTAYTSTGIEENAVIVISNGKIESVQQQIPPGANIIDMAGWNIAPGLIDVQINGGEQHYFSHSLSEESLHDVCDSSLIYGATHILPCLISSPREKILEAIELVKNFQQKCNKGMLGMHLEGPFIHPDKRGAHNKGIIRQPTNSELEEIIKYGKDVIKLMTIAPEQFTDDQIEMLMESGINLSIGHTTIGYEQAKFYFAKGISLVTHLFNAMTQFMHREPGLVGAVLDTHHVYAPVILDGAHCHYAAARIAYAVKKEKMILLSDAAFLGRKKTSFESPLLSARLTDGFYRNDEGNLAGAAISMVEAVWNAERYLNIPRQEVLRMGSTGVAAAIKMDDQVGKIAKGYPASFLCFTDDWSAYKTMLIS